MPVYSVKYKGTKEYHLVYCALIQAARNRSVVDYLEIASIMGIHTTGSHMARELGIMLGSISEAEVSQGRPLLGALAVSSVDHRPGEGFFVLAKQLGIFCGGDEEEETKFWEMTRQEVYQTWAI